MKNIPIKIKLLGSFLVIVIFVIALVAFSNFGISKIGQGFTDYREMAKNSILAGSVQANMLQTRMSVLKYFDEPIQKHVESFEKEYAQTQNFVHIALKEIQDTKRAPLVKKLDDELETYKTNFEKLTSSMAKRDEIVNNNLNINGKKIEQLLSSIMLSAEKDGDTRVSLDTAHAIRFLLLGRLYGNKFLLTNLKDDAAMAHDEFSNLSNELIDIKNGITNTTRKSQLNEAIELIAIYKKGLDDIINIINERNSFMDKLSEIGPNIARISEDIKLSIKADQDKIGPMVAELDKQISTISIIISIIVLIVVILSAIIIPKEIITQLESFKNGLLGFFKYLNREADDCDRLDDSRKNEIGTMAKVVNTNIDKTKKGVQEDRKFIDDTVVILKDFEQGDFSQQITTNVSNPPLNELKNVVNAMARHVKDNTEEVLDVLEQYTHYNFMEKVETGNVRHHLFQLSDGVNKLGDSIVKMLTNEKRVGLTLSESSKVLLRNVNVLNDVSNEAAASLEETAAALEEITSTIISNTENVIDMANFANKVTNSVDEGNTLANQTTSSMDEINNQVSSINEAITVIDQIAFQTNILSLNAAVEAATAGEAGKGFSVVAQEVRNLATRSAEAAKEIKELVENATMKANDGKIIADKMIHGYTDLNENIRKTIELINQVEAASKEQKAGIEQINDAVSAQDQQTQQIAAAATETHEIAVHSSHISEQIVENVDKKEFPGKDQIVERREKQYDLEYHHEDCRRSSEKVIKEHKKKSGRPHTPKQNTSSKKTEEIPETNKKPKVEQKTISSNSTNDDEWESF